VTSSRLRPCNPPGFEDKEAVKDAKETGKSGLAQEFSQPHCLPIHYATYKKRQHDTNERTRTGGVNEARFISKRVMPKQKKQEKCKNSQRERQDKNAVSERYSFFPVADQEFNRVHHISPKLRSLAAGFNKCSFMLNSSRNGPLNVRNCGARISFQ
jgi:hypothetical protein